MNDPKTNAVEFAPVRLQKWLAELGLFGRREADRLLSEGRITIDGAVARPGAKIIPGDNQVSVDGSPVELDRGVKQAPKVYWLFNKPDFTLVSRRSQNGMATIFDCGQLKKVPFPVSPIGRLDFRTQGLLLLSNDGELVHRLMHPSYKVKREYQVLVNRKLTSQEQAQLRSGKIVLDDGPVKPQTIEYLGSESTGKGSAAWYLISVTEGRNRIVRRTFESFGCRVLKLTRTAIGTLRLPTSLPQGRYQQLSSAEIRYLKSLVSMEK